MPRQDLLDLVLRQFSDGRERTLEEVVSTVVRDAAIVSESDARSAVLTLLRRNELLLTDDFKLQQSNMIVPA
jgi:hypothetical protein